ncbi:MAG: DUF4446 family protein [Eubacterium sp.]|nr:DUF4446 family protein [Eubacterium sp.]
MKELFNGIGTGFGTIFIILIIAVIVLLLLTGWLILRLNRLQYRMQVFMRGKDGKSLEQNIIDRLQEIDKMSGRVNMHHADLVAVRRQIGTTLTHYGIVKYDAFDDVGGKLSFVLAMLDDKNTGFVLDAIHSRDNCFVYLKEIVNGESYIMLSAEEIQALRIAAGSDEEAELEI